MRATRAMAMATNRTIAMAAIAMATWQRQLVWLATKKVRVQATKRVMGTNGNNLDNGCGKEGGGRSMAAMMGMAQRTRPPCYNWREGGGGGRGSRIRILI